MDKEQVVEELIAQRDAVLFGKWRRDLPSRIGEACLVYRRVQDQKEPIWVGADAERHIAGALADKEDSYHYNYASSYELTCWNDDLPRTGRKVVLDVLDEAIRRAKDA